MGIRSRWKGARFSNDRHDGIDDERQASAASGQTTSLWHGEVKPLHQFSHELPFLIADHG